MPPGKPKRVCDFDALSISAQVKILCIFLFSLWHTAPALSIPAEPLLKFSIWLLQCPFKCESKALSYSSSQHCIYIAGKNTHLGNCTCSQQLFKLQSKCSKRTVQAYSRKKRQHTLRANTLTNQNSDQWNKTAMTQKDVLDNVHLPLCLDIHFARTLVESPIAASPLCQIQPLNHNSFTINPWNTFLVV